MATYYAAPLLIAADKALVVNISYYGTVSYHPDPAYGATQYGCTFGGLIRKEKIFFFADYKGERDIECIETGFVSAPSMANRSEDFRSASTFNGPYLAQVLSQRLGKQVSQGDLFAKVFPDGKIPMSTWGAAPTRLLQYIPEPNAGVNQFSTGAYKRRCSSR